MSPKGLPFDVVLALLESTGWTLLKVTDDWRVFRHSLDKDLIVFRVNDRFVRRSHARLILRRLLEEEPDIQEERRAR